VDPRQHAGVAGGLLVLGLALAFAAATRAAEVDAVARPQLRGAAPGAQGGTVFFLPTGVGPGAVAIGAAHVFDPTALAEAGEVAFVVGAEAERVAVSRRYLTRPGRPSHRPGATLREAFVVFALEAPPESVRLLEPAPELPAPGARVSILGAPKAGGRSPVRIAGTVVRSEETRIEIELDAPADLGGMGGAPVLEVEGGRVVGLLQTAWPAGDGIRAGVGPIGGVVEALAQPLDGGLGRLFASLAPPPSAATDTESRRRAATGSPFGDQAPERTAAAVMAAAAHGDVLRQRLAPRSLEIELEHPAPEAVVGDAAGVFVAGRAFALREGVRRFDIAIVIDTSGSTNAPTGVDVNGNGIVGEPVPGPMGIHSTDPGDSILAAQVAAAERLLEGLDPRSTRVSLVTFAGELVLPRSVLPAPLAWRREALTEEPLTSDHARLRAALARVRDRGGSGLTHMAAGIDQASAELLGLGGTLSRADPESEKVVLFFTDGIPTLPHPSSEAGNVRAVVEAAQRARRVGVRIHAFAIGPEALEGPVSTVEMASITGGTFTPVRHPGEVARFVEIVSFAHLEDVRIRNTTSRRVAYATRVGADGSFDALVPLVEGENRLEVRARAEGGAEAVHELTVRHVPGAASPRLPVELVARHNAHLEARLGALRRELLEAHQRRAEVVRRELRLEVERERAAALERAARQRKELEIELVRPEGP
jgi:hypothetical protein